MHALSAAAILSAQAPATEPAGSWPSLLILIIGTTAGILLLLALSASRDLD